MLLKKHIRKAQDIYDIACDEPILVYGAGFVADFFYKLLVQKGLERNLLGFIVSKNGGGVLNGLPIYAVNDTTVEKHVVVCVAVHESSLAEIIQSLESNGFGQYVYVYPNLIEMWLGEPLKKKERVSVRDIWNSKDDKYVIAARYLVIEQYHGENSIGYDLYKKMSVLPKNSKTVEKRLDKYLEMISDCECHGYDFEKTIKIFDDYKIIDGNHRFTAAIYFGHEYVDCDIYAASNKKGLELLPSEKRLNHDNVMQLGLTEYEIGILEQTISKINNEVIRGKNDSQAHIK